MLTFINPDIIMFFNLFPENRGVKKIHNLSETLGYKVFRFPGNIRYRQ